MAWRSRSELHGWDKGSAANSSAEAGNQKNRIIPYAIMSG
jgi:hypothetical protein